MPNYSLKRTAAYRRLCYHAVRGSGRLAQALGPMRVTVLSLLLLCWRIGACCSCGHLPYVADDTLRNAEHIFVFRLISAEVDVSHPNEITWDANGRIEHVESLRGNGKQFPRIRFSTLSFCCGARFDVGQFYIGFASGSGPVFEANTGNVLSTGSAGYEAAKSFLARVMAGKAKLDDSAAPFDQNRTQQVPPPPQPPCPKEHDRRPHGT